VPKSEAGRTDRAGGKERDSEEEMRRTKPKASEGGFEVEV
jgi:hypothetical protein